MDPKQFRPERPRPAPKEEKPTPENTYEALREMVSYGKIDVDDLLLARNEEWIDEKQYNILVNIIVDRLR